MTKPNMIVFMGGQGSGKGTFAHMLLSKYNFNYVEAGAILRQMPADSTIGKKVANGELIDDDNLFSIIAEHIKPNHDVILDGFPRTLNQAKWLINNYADKFNIQIIFLNITEDKMIAHIKKRIYEGGNRKDDEDEAAVRKRIDAFKTNTIPAIRWLSNVDGIKFFDVRLSSDDICENFELILHTLQ